MSSNFSLLSLNIKEWDKHPRTWICIGGKDIRINIEKMEREILKTKSLTREGLSGILEKSLNCNKNTMKNILRGSYLYYPIPVVIKLFELLDKNKDYKKNIENNIQYLKVNSASAKTISAPKVLSKTLAKIIGAFCADGSLSIRFVISSKNKEKLEEISKEHKLIIKNSQSRKEYYVAIQLNKENLEKIKLFSKENVLLNTQTHYTIELTDEHKTNVDAFNKWIFEEFNIYPTKYYHKDNAYRTIFSNKILARYLIQFFEMTPGYKCDIVDEPKIIKDSNLDIRKEFAKGVLMFDGHISKRKTILFSSISPFLAKSIKEILLKDNIKIGHFKNNRREYTIYTTTLNDIKKLLYYFEKKTKKWELLMWLTNSKFESNQITNEKDMLQANNILEILKKVYSCDANYLMKNLGYSHTTIRQHLLMLKFKGWIKLSNRPNKVSTNISSETGVFLKNKFHNLIFGKIIDKFKNYEEFSVFLEIHKATLSAWKVKKNKIPLKNLMEMCATLEIPYSSALKNIDETDREIAEII